MDKVEIGQKWNDEDETKKMRMMFLTRVTLETQVSSCWRVTALVMVCLGLRNPLREEWQEATDSPLALHLHLLWRTNHTVEEQSRMFSRIQTSVYTEMKGKSSYLLNESLNDLVLIRHVRDHVRHVVFRGSDKSWAKHNGQVTWLHLIKYKESFP